MVEFLESGALIDAILVLLALEALAFLVLYKRVSTAPRLFAPHLAVLWPTLLSGALLMLAVRLAITDVHWMWVASVLAAAGLSHVVDIALRFRRL